MYSLKQKKQHKFRSVRLLTKVLLFLCNFINAMQMRTNRTLLNFVMQLSDIVRNCSAVDGEEDCSGYSGGGGTERFRKSIGFATFFSKNEMFHGENFAIFSLCAVSWLRYAVNDLCSRETGQISAPRFHEIAAGKGISASLAEIFRDKGSLRSPAVNLASQINKKTIFSP